MKYLHVAMIYYILGKQPKRTRNIAALSIRGEFYLFGPFMKRIWPANSADAHLSWFQCGLSTWANRYVVYNAPSALIPVEVFK